MQTTKPHNKWVLLKKAAELTGHTPKALMNQIHTGKLPVNVVVKKSLGRWYMNMDEFNHLIETSL